MANERTRERSDCRDDRAAGREAFDRVTVERIEADDVQTSEDSGDGSFLDRFFRPRPAERR